MFTAQRDTFRSWVPFDVLEKGADDEADGVASIRGVATSERTDKDGDIIIQKGIDWDEFTKSGFLTYEHPLGAANIVGEPRKIERSEVQGFPATILEGALYRSDPLGKMLISKARSMQKAGGNRRLGFSIEGHVRQRDPDAPNRVTKSIVRSVAITPVPKNEDSWFEPIAASLGMLAAFNGTMSTEQLVEVLQRAEKIGHPAQGEAAVGTGGIDKLARQSLQGVKGKRAKMSSKTYQVSIRDLATMMILKKKPQWKWAQGRALADAILNKLNLKEFKS
jgi:hypothetical protein